MPDKEPEIECALDGCSEVFYRRVHNQRFCSKECCRVYTNARILAAYHRKKNKKMTGRVCKQKSCITQLSRYNQGEKCAVHEQKDYVNKLKGWGWDVDDEGNRRI